jgi:hypothetical protein
MDELLKDEDPMEHLQRLQAFNNISRKEMFSIYQLVLLLTKKETIHGMTTTSPFLLENKENILKHTGIQIIELSEARALLKSGKLKKYKEKKWVNIPID